MTGDLQWRYTPAAGRAVAVLLLCVGIALLLGVPVLAVLAWPLALGVALAWRRPATVSAGLDVDVPALVRTESDDHVTVTLSAPSDAQVAVVELPGGTVSAAGSTSAVAIGDGPRTFRAPLDTSSWGIREPGSVRVRIAGPDGLRVAAPISEPVPQTRVVPPVTIVPVAEVPARSAGLVGSHRTRRPGDGSELASIREFRSGDRIRRVDWKVTARRGELHVRETAIDADADLMICIDTRSDGAGELAPGSLAVAIEAATSLAASYLRVGDQVGLIDPCVPQRCLLPGSGRRQLTRIRWLLAGLSPDPNLRIRSWWRRVIPANATVFVLSPFLDDSIAGWAAEVAAADHDVVAIDVLPDVGSLPKDRIERAAARLLLAERAGRIDRLGDYGVLTVRWEPALMAALMKRRQRVRRSV